jgi:hypothetical protein
MKLPTGAAERSLAERGEERKMTIQVVLDQRATMRYEVLERAISPASHRRNQA